MPVPDPRCSSNPDHSFKMPPKSTAAEKKPASTAGKAPAKAPESAVAKKAAAKTGGAAEGEKKKRKKSRKETYSSYIYKGASTLA
jgi:histone H2B